jgi:hypothetical protein
MVRRTHARKLVLTVITVVSATLLATTGSSTADVTAVRGEAYASFASVSLFGGPANVRGPFAEVTLPTTGSAVPITATAPDGSVIIGPATIFSSGPVNTSTQGTTGPDGSVTSTATLAPVNTSGQEVFTATSISSTCTASETGVTGSTTVVGGTIVLQDPNPDTSGEMGENIQTIPTNPAPNTTYEGTVANVNDNFRAVFNEQIVNPDGSLTVNAYHLYLLGPTAVGEVIVGHVVCGVTAVPSTTTTSTTTTSTTIPPTTTSSTTTTLPPTTTSSTTTTLPPTTTSSTTTTLPPTTTSSTTTTLPPTTTSSTTTTLPPTTTSSTTTTLPPTTTTLPPTTTTLPPTTTTVPATTTTTAPPTTTTTPPASGTCSQLQAQKAAFNAQITAIEASLAQTLSGAELAAAIAQLEATRASGNAQFDAAIAACNGTTTTTTSSTTTTVPPTTTTTIAPPPSNAEVCAVLRPLADNPFLAPFVQQLLIQYGCLT